MQIRVPSLHQIRQHAESVKVCRPACKRPVASPLLQIPPFHPFAFPLLPAQTPPAVESWLGQRKSLGFPPLPLRSAAQTCVAHQDHASPPFPEDKLPPPRPLFWAGLCASRRHCSTLASCSNDNTSATLHHCTYLEVTISLSSNPVPDQLLPRAKHWVLNYLCASTCRRSRSRRGGERNTIPPSPGPVSWPHAVLMGIQSAPSRSPIAFVVPTMSPALRPTTARPPVENQPPPPPVGLRWRSSTWFIVSTVGMGIFTDMVLYCLIVPVLPFMLQDRIHLPDAEIQSQVSNLLAVYAAASVISSPITGLLADKWGTRQLPFLLGLTALLIATFLLALGQTILALIVARALQGLSAAVVWVVGLALLVETVGSDRMGAVIGSVCYLLLLKIVRWSSSHG